MTSVAIYSEQPILTAGLQAVVAGLEDFTFSGLFTALDPLLEHVRAHRPNVLLFDVTSAVTFTTLSKLRSVAANVPIVLWVNAASRGFVSQALALGIRGILRKSSSIELQIKCLRNVAAGDLWLDQDLRYQLLTSKGVRLTGRERALMAYWRKALRTKRSRTL